MSILLTEVVLKSALSPEIKPVAALLATYADSDGNRIFPSVGRVAWEVGISRRQAQRHFDRLRRIGVLVPVSSGKGGRSRTTRYRMDEAAIPKRAAYESVSQMTPIAVPRAAHCASDETVSKNKNTSPADRSVSLMTTKHDADDTRSVSDPPDRSASAARDEISSRPIAIESLKGCDLDRELSLADADEKQWWLDRIRSGGCSPEYAARQLRLVREAYRQMIGDGEQSRISRSR